MRNIFYFTPAISVEFCTFAKNINMKLFEYTWFTDFHGAIEDLKSIAMKEDWDYKNNPIGKKSNIRKLHKAHICKTLRRA